MPAAVKQADLNDLLEEEAVGAPRTVATRVDAGATSDASLRTSSDTAAGKISTDTSAVSSRFEAKPQSVEGYLQGDRIAIGDTRYEIAAFDPETGDVILRGREHSQDLESEVVRGEDLADKLASYRRLELDGKTYYLRDNKVFVVENLMNNRKLIVAEPGFSIMPRQDLASAEFLGGGEIRRE